MKRRFETYITCMRSMYREVWRERKKGGEVKVSK